MASEKIPRLKIEHDPNDRTKKTITRMECEVDAEIEVTQDDGNVLRFVLRAGVPMTTRVERVAGVMAKTFASGKSVPVA
jgi:hypothetical protein